MLEQLVTNIGIAGGVAFAAFVFWKFLVLLRWVFAPTDNDKRERARAMRSDFDPTPGEANYPFGPPNPDKGGARKWAGDGLYYHVHKDGTKEPI